MKIHGLFVMVFLGAGSAWAAPGVGEGPCRVGSDCGTGTCVEVNGDAYCSKTCGSCPSGMYCDAQLFSHVGIKVCLKGKVSAPVQPKSAPKLPCRSDAECEGGLICAQSGSARSCTKPCSDDSECKMPQMMGMTVDFFECAADGQRTRKACVVKTACQTNPMSCVKLDATGMTQGAQGFVDFAQQVEAGMPSLEEPDLEKAAPAAPPATRSPAPKPNKPKAMDAARFRQLLRQIEDADFSDEKTLVIETAAKRNHFTCQQLTQMVKLLEFTNEKLAAVRLVAPKLVDRENTHLVLSGFEFSGEKKKAAKILEAQD